MSNKPPFSAHTVNGLGVTFNHDSPLSQRRA